MTLAEMDGAYKRLPLMRYGKDFVTPEVKQTPVQHIGGILYKSRHKGKYTSQMWCHIYIFFEQAGLGLLWHSLSISNSVEQVIASVPFSDAEGFLQHCDATLNKGKHLPLGHIKLVEWLDATRAAAYHTYRQQMEDSRLRAQKARHDERRTQTNLAVAEAHKIMASEGDILNDTVDVPRGDGLNTDEVPLFIHLLALEGITVTEHTRNWIRLHLHGVTYKHGIPTGVRLTRKGSPNSRTFPNLLVQLYHKRTQSRKALQE